MSGGHFDYLQNRLNDIIEQLESDVASSKSPATAVRWDTPLLPEFGEDGLRYQEALLSLCLHTKTLLDAYDLAVSGDTSEKDFVAAAKDELAQVAKVCRASTTKQTQRIQVPG